MELRYSWTKAVTIDDYSPLFATIRTIRILFAIRHYSLFAIRYSRLFAIRYSGFSDTRRHFVVTTQPLHLVPHWDVAGKQEEKVRKSSAIYI